MTEQPVEKIYSLLNFIGYMFGGEDEIVLLVKDVYKYFKEHENNRSFEVLGLAAPMDKKTETKLRRNVHNK